MAARTVRGTVRFQGFPCVGARVVASLGYDGVALSRDGGVVAGSPATVTDRSGAWALALEPNELIDPSGTAWHIKVTRPGGDVLVSGHVRVPDSAGPHNFADLLVDGPAPLPSVALERHQSSQTAHGLSAKQRLFAIHAADFGMAVSASADANQLALDAAISAAWAGGLPLVLPSGALAVNGHTSNFSGPGVLDVRGQNTTLVASSNSTVLNIGCSWSSVAVAGITLSDPHEFPEQTIPRNATRLTFAPGHGLKAGDVVRVTSEDEIPGWVRFATKCGQFAVVGDVSDNDVWLTSVLRSVDRWTAGLKVWKIPSVSVQVSGITFDMRSSDGIGLQLVGLLRPGVDRVRFLNVAGSALVVKGCLDPVVRNVSGKNMQAFTQSFPYLVVAAHSEGGTFEGLSAVHMRHAFTTGAGVTDSSDGRTYGRTAHCTVAGGTATACIGGFDTHGDAYNVTFVGCNAVNSIAGRSAPGVGFSFRGFDVSAIGCTADGAYDGFLVYNDVSSDTGRVSLVACRTRNVSRYAVNIDATENIDEVSIAECDLESDQHGVYADGAGQVRVQGGRIEVTAPYYRHVFAASTSVDVSGTRFKCNSPSGVFYLADADTSVLAEGIHVYGGASAGWLARGLGKFIGSQVHMDSWPDSVIDNTLLASSMVRREGYDSSPPSTGAWRSGDVVWCSAPSAGGYIGWVCTSSGTPGVWKAFGGIA